MPCVVCSGSSASLQRLPGAEELPVNLVVVAVEPAEKNFQLLLQHAKEHAWDAEGFLPLKAISFFCKKRWEVGGGGGVLDGRVNRGANDMNFQQNEHFRSTFVQFENK